MADRPEDLGFTLTQQRRDGTRQYSQRAHPYLSYWLLVHGDGSAEFSWELALGEYLEARGFSVSAQDALSLLMFPSAEARGRLEGDWLRRQMDQTRDLLASLDLAGGS